MIYRVLEAEEDAKIAVLPRRTMIFLLLGLLILHMVLAALDIQEQLIMLLEILLIQLNLQGEIANKTWEITGLHILVKRAQAAREAHILIGIVRENTLI